MEGHLIHEIFWTHDTGFFSIYLCECFFLEGYGSIILSVYTFRASKMRRLKPRKKKLVHLMVVLIDMDLLPSELNLELGLLEFLF